MVFAYGLQNPEGPVALPDGTWLIVEGGAERGLHHPHQRRRQEQARNQEDRPPQRPGRRCRRVIWVAESKTPSLLRVTMDGKCEVVATGCDGEPFLFPNDLCFGPDGALYT